MDSTIQYVFVLDALNFCFWPVPGLEYVDLATGLRRAVERDPRCLDAANLARLDADSFRALMPDVETWPDLPSRVRAVNELGAALLSAESSKKAGGLASAWVREAGPSARRLVDLVRERLPMFRDEAPQSFPSSSPTIYFYKRAQILAADVWAACGRKRDGSGLGAFTDVDALTTFPDYRVPQLLREMGVMVYDDDLAARVDARVELAPGSDEELDIRACTVAAVHALREAALRRARAEGRSEDEVPCDVEIDWLLWQRGEATMHAMRPHHRVRTVFY